MKLALVSDVHLEFADWYPCNPDQADVLLLAGDIMLASDLNGTYKSERFKEFLTNCKREYKDVIYIMGNHEHYNGDFATSHELLREACDINSIYFLDKEVAIINNVTFIGGTLWTDMNKEDPKTINQISYLMNDFRIIQNSNKTTSFKDTKGNFQQRYSKFSPEDCVEDHKTFLKVIDDTVTSNPTGTFVVVGHHAPSKKSTKPGYEKDLIVGGAYSSDLDEFILSHPQIKVWVHGHTHDKFDYMIGSTRIVSNARGYVGYERGTDKEDPFFPVLIEV
jgi:predicted phosphodiesterase